MQQKKLTAGFTLVESLIIIPIVIIGAAFLAYLFYFQYWVFNTQNAELSVASDARGALDAINEYVRQSSRVAANYSTYTTGAQTLVLQVPSLDGSGQIISGTFDNAVVYLTGTNLYLQVFPHASSARAASTKKIASDVDANTFAFTYDNASYASVTQVTTTLTINKAAWNQVSSSQTRSITLSSQATLRNY